MGRQTRRDNRSRDRPHPGVIRPDDPPERQPAVWNRDGQRARASFMSDQKDRARVANKRQWSFGRSAVTVLAAIFTIVQVIQAGSRPRGQWLGGQSTGGTLRSPRCREGRMSDQEDRDRAARLEELRFAKKQQWYI